VSDARTPDPAKAVPSAEELKRTAIPAAIRHAPRFGRMVGTGVWIGIGVAVVLGSVLPNSTGVGRFVVILLLSLGFVLIGGLIGGVIVTRLDKPGPGASDQPLFPQDAVADTSVDADGDAPTPPNGDHP
jgi:hypothetical protein